MQQDSNNQTEKIPEMEMRHIVVEPPKLESNLDKKNDKRRNTLPTTLAFLVGALTYAVFGAGYNLYTQQLKENAEVRLADKQAAEKKTMTQTPILQDKDSVTSEELENYVDVTNCSTKPEYTKYEAKFQKGLVTSIDLYDGVVATVKEPGTSRTSIGAWSEPPVVVDYKCNKLAMSEIMVGDRVNVYGDMGSIGGTVSLVKETRILQKANK